MKDLDTLTRDLARYRPRHGLLRRRAQRAAVAVILRQQRQGIEALLIERAARPGDPWSGHMAFPGGKIDAGDAHTCATACRETAEEIGLRVDPQTCIGRLRGRPTLTHSRRRRMVVSPFVFRLDDTRGQWRYNHEVANHFWVPLMFLAEPYNRQRMPWRAGPTRLSLPCYDFRQRRIWGLTLMMLDELVALTGA